MKTYVVDVSVRLSRAVTVGVPDGWDAGRAEQYVADLMAGGELCLDPDADHAETRMGAAEECGPDPRGNEPDFVAPEVADCEPPNFDDYDFTDADVAMAAARAGQDSEAVR